MKNKLHILIKYRLVGLLVLLSTLVWGQTNNQKYLTKNHPEKVLKGTHQPIESLSIHPAAKALLERARTRETTQQNTQTAAT